eukprot:NODE_7403_length_1582_cov_2.118900.p1 GENE.NODE_7403_length_1582_cov_2.118900~~NODE_7403_length_1582_cov_2.118900.p1  ORF type:complete len:400 (-),score=103.15 NODE_7403_length_1582_cov_2.118900:153-1352(-)
MASGPYAGAVSSNARDLDIGGSVPVLVTEPETLPCHSIRSHNSSSESSDMSDCTSSTGSSSAATATRARSGLCPLSAVFGDAPLPRIENVGWYFRLRVNSANAGWIGGFAIGVTLCDPTSLAALPDRASRVPRSWLAGYWGRTYSNGREHACSWRPQTLRADDEVGFLVDLDGECVVYVNDEEVCRFADPPVPVTSVELTTLLDVASAAASVTLLSGAPPPPAAVHGWRPHGGTGCGSVAMRLPGGVSSPPPPRAPSPPPPSPSTAKSVPPGRHEHPPQEEHVHDHAHEHEHEHREHEHDHVHEHEQQQQQQQQQQPRQPRQQLLGAPVVPPLWHLRAGLAATRQHGSSTPAAGTGGSSRGAPPGAPPGSTATASTNGNVATAAAAARRCVPLLPLPVR